MLIHQLSKFMTLLWVCWFLCKNLSNFMSPAWKLNNSYYYKMQIGRKQYFLHIYIYEFRLILSDQMCNETTRLKFKTLNWPNEIFFKRAKNINHECKIVFGFDLQNLQKNGSNLCKTQKAAKNWSSNFFLAEEIMNFLEKLFITSKGKFQIGFF